MEGQFLTEEKAERWISGDILEKFSSWQGKITTGSLLLTRVSHRFGGRSVSNFRHQLVIKLPLLVIPELLINSCFEN